MIVTYFPDSRFVERLKKILLQVDYGVIVDNTPGISRSGLMVPVNEVNVEIIHNLENLGVGEALNQGMARAIVLGYPWVITFDQDTWVRDGLVTKLMDIYEQQPQPESIGIIGTNFIDENIHVSPIQYKGEEPFFSEVQTVITSGSLIPTDVFSAVGPFRSEFFIDFIDHEYCLRLHKFGYKVISSIAPLMVHALGDAEVLNITGRLGGISLVLTHRSPLRRYYMTRNGLVVAREYFTIAPLWVAWLLSTIIIYSLMKIPLEKSARWNKLRSTVHGLLDAFRRKTGKAPSADWLTG